MLEDEGANGMEGSVDDMNNTVGLGSKRRRRAQNSPNSPKLQKRTRLNFDHAEDREMVEDTSTETRHHMASRWGYTTDAAEGPSSDREASNRTSPSTPIRHEASAHRRGGAGRSIYAWVMTPKDEEGHPPHHPDYDPTTLHIPPSVYPTFGHVERQYWDIKRKHWDVILLFEWLRSYVLVGNDAIVAQELLGLPLSSGSRVYLGDPRCAQVPTPTTPYVRTLLKHGYSVAYVETVHDVDDEEDTLFIPDDRSSTTTASGLVRRRMGTILTASTVTDPDLLCSDMPTFCMALRQDEDGQELRFGVTLIDMASGEIYLYGFTDGIALTRLGMLLACTSPTTVIVERKKHVSNDVKRLLIAHTSRVRGCLTVSASLLWKSKHNIALLTQCFTETTWPAVLVEALEQPLVMAALGGLLGQLRRQKILSATMLTRCSYHWYDPNGGTSKLLLYPQTWDGLHLGHDRPTGEYTLFRKLDRCATPFGKRLLYRWLCHPLVDSGQINARLDAIDTLYGNKRLVKTLTSMLRSLPDLTRIMSRVRLRSCQAKDVAKAIQGLEHIRALACTLAPSDGKGNPITALVASWPSLDATLERWMEVFDQEEALYANVFIPPTGTYDDYDRSHSALLACIHEKDEYLTRIRTELASPAIELRKGTTTDRTRANDYLYIPVNVKIPSTWERYRTKERGRYCPPEGLAIAAALQDAEFAHTTIMQEVARDILDKFDRESTLWTTIIDKVAELDCLLSLTAASESMGVPVCRPTFVEEGRTVVDFQDLRHPFPPDRTTTFVANDILLGGSFAPISLLTGANASGKSTVMRVTCTAIILAQMGCYVPCKSACLTPLDRIITRVGGSDDIFASSSTFKMELDEVNRVLWEATDRSFITIDELGRGTCVRDGAAIAYAVLHDVATRIGCVGFFATHYHSLTRDFSNHPAVAPKRMRIRLPEQGQGIIFTYQLEDGIADGSYGMHCAAACGIPSTIIRQAEAVAVQASLGHTLRPGHPGNNTVLAGWQSDIAHILREEASDRSIDILLAAIASGL